MAPYPSLFDKLQQEFLKTRLWTGDPAQHATPLPWSEFSETGELLAYEGPFVQVLDELETALTSHVQDEGTLLARILHPPRIVRAVIDDKIHNPWMGKLRGWLKDALHLAQAVYEQSPAALPLLYRLRQEWEGDYLLMASVFQKADGATWMAMDPYRSARTAEEMIRTTDRAPVLFLALAHGGVAAGLDVFLRYQQLADNPSSAFYAVRFSRDKHSDKRPHVDFSETLLFGELRQNRTLILFDEDEYSGTTLSKARSFFAETLSPHLFAFVNHLCLDKEAWHKL